MAVSFISLDRDLPALSVTVQVTKFIVDGEDVGARRLVLDRLRERAEDAQAALDTVRLASD